MTVFAWLDLNVPNQRTEFYFMGFHFYNSIFCQENYNFMNFQTFNIQENAVKSEEEKLNMLNYVVSFIKEMKECNTELIVIELPKELQLIEYNLRNWLNENKMNDVKIRLDIEN